MNQEIATATASICLYAVTAIGSIWFYLRLCLNTSGKLALFCSSKKHNRTSAEVLQSPRTKRVIRRKKMFFGILAISSLLNIPYFAGCIILNGPTFCVWDNISCNLSAICHIMSLCGYCILFSLPPLMWSEIIQGRTLDNYYATSWFSCSCSNGFDVAKIFIVGSSAIYIFVQIMTIAGLLWSLSKPNKMEFLGLPLYKDCAAVESAAIIVQIVSWLFVNLKLQCYVISVKFEKQEQRRILLRINATLIVLCVCYCIRAYILFLVPQTKEPDSYLEWVCYLYWLPYIFCSWLLSGLMNRKEKPKVEVIVMVQNSLHKCKNLEEPAVEIVSSSHNSLWDGDADVFPGTTTFESTFGSDMTEDLLQSSHSFSCRSVPTEGNNWETASVKSDTFNEVNMKT